MCHSKPPVKLDRLAVLLLVLLCYGAGNVHCSTVHDNSEDLHALLNFKQGVTSDPYGALTNWTTSAHFCLWNGVTCTSNRPWRVFALDLNSKNLEGQISSSLGNLTFLNYLYLFNNSFAGPLPLLGRLQQLKYLYLNTNNLSGIIPDALTNCSSLNGLDLSKNVLADSIPSKLGLLSNLSYINLSSNLLVGSIPPELGQLSNLTSIDLSSNLLVGSIPPELGQLSNLMYLNLGSNRLEGSIPGELGRLVHLGYLLLNGNRLSGEVPPDIFNLSSIQYLSLGMNMLSKTLPPNMGDFLPNLMELSMANNSFEGHIPASLGNAPQLRKIDLSFNNFTGPIPTSLGKLSNLIFLGLEYNQLVARDDKDWEFLNALGNCKNLEMLSFTRNNLSGSLSPSIGNLSTSLQHLLLNKNSLSGQIPLELGKLTGLIRLILSDNYFEGTIDGWIPNLRNLQVLVLHSNNLTGPIPSTIGSLTRLVHLDLNENEFNGPIPASLGNLPRLQELYLSYNNLQGFIPQNFGSLQQLIMLDLSHNDLQGSITQIGNLEELNTLDLSWNKLTGQIPDSLGQCHGLVIMRMDQNFLTGSIPSTFGNLTTLSMLNLSHNNLSGTIPQALNVLGSLIKLDLSYNHLHGNVPRNGIFENAAAVSLEGNQGLCGGAMALQMPSCAADSKKTETGYYLIRVLIPIFGFMSLILLVYVLFLVKKMPSRKYLSLNALGDNFIKVSYTDLVQATCNFSESNLVGRGSYGSVYRGKLKESKLEVAVKVFDLEMGGAEKSFMKECEVLRSIQHRNLLSILTACSTVDNTGNVLKALVYRFIANGNLDRWLHHTEDRKSHKPLSFTQRLSIAVNIADALDYLHHDCGRPTIHCDLKPSNVLLDDDMNALLIDFGIASIYRESSSTSTGPINSSVGVKGTIGYIAPEYAGGGRRASASDDVYAFGIILLEMMTGRRPTDPMFKDGVSIVNFVDTNFPHQIFRVIDAPLVEESKDFAQANMASVNSVQQSVVSVLQVALSCTNLIPSERMTMKETASRMQAIQMTHIERESKAKN